MGGYERFCFACGGPTRCNGNIYDIQLIRFLLKKAKHGLSTKKYDEFVSFVNWISIYDISNNDIIYELEYRKINNIFLREEIQQLLKSKKSICKQKKYNWLKNVLILHKNGTNISIKKSDTWDGNYYNKNGTEYWIDQRSFKKQFLGDGYIIHNICYKLLQKKYFKFNFEDITNKKINYGLIQKYQQQDIPWMDYLLDINQFLLSNPLTNIRNKQRILKIKLPINAIIKTNRCSPSISATNMKLGDIRIGNDGNKWIIIVTKNNIQRWQKYKINIM